VVHSSLMSGHLRRTVRIALVATLAVGVWLFASRGPSRPRWMWTWREAGEVQWGAPHFVLAMRDTLVVGAEINRPRVGWVVRVVGLDAASGRERWRWESSAIVEPHYGINQIKSLPDGAVVVAFAINKGAPAPHPDLVCLEGATGKLRWQWRRAEGVRWAFIAPELHVCAADGVLITTYPQVGPKELACILQWHDPATGAVRWVRGDGSEPPAFEYADHVARLAGGDLVLAGHGATATGEKYDLVTRVESATGRSVWENRVAPESVSPWHDLHLVTSASDEIFAAALCEDQAHAQSLRATQWSPEDGRQLWSGRVALESEMTVPPNLITTVHGRALHVVTNQSFIADHFSFAKMRRNPRNPRAWREVRHDGVAWQHSFHADDGKYLGATRLGPLPRQGDGFSTGRWESDGALFLAGIWDEGAPVETLRRATGSKRVTMRALFRPFAHGWSNYLPLPDGRIAGSGQDASGPEPVWWIAAW
jgi:hypothetical protein